MLLGENTGNKEGFVRILWRVPKGISYKRRQVPRIFGHKDGD